jgi:N-acetylneuraminic acid mutarotase
MAERAIGPGSMGQRRVLFGLLDGNGWTWASLKATFWFVFIIMMLGYIPDRAYYFTVFPTIDLGVLVYSPVNFCPPSNRTVPCPPPVGSVLPWDPSPKELALPAGRTGGTAVQLGLNLVYVGGSDGKAATDTTFTAPLYSGNFGPWQTGPVLPAARSGAAVAVFNSAAYVVGGYGPDGKPTDTVYVAEQDVSTAPIGAFKPNDTLKLPEARADAAIVVASDGLILVGGTNGTAAQPTVWKSTVDSNGKLAAWAPQQALPTGLTATAAAIVGDFLFVYGGQDANGPTNAVFRGSVSKDKATLGQVTQWATPTGQAATRIDLPAPRAHAGAWSANAGLYLVGGADANGPQPQLYWTVPDAQGEINGWQHLDATDLPTGVAGTSAIVSGSNVFLIGGTTTDQPALTASARANLAPQPPFFQLGLFGLTIPALKIGGEIGQQLGYMNAAGAATINFIILILIGWAFAHKERSKAILARFTGRRGRRA